MVKCPRCGRDVDELQTATPDLISREVLNSIDHGEDDFTGEDGVEICSGCLSELKKE